MSLSNANDVPGTDGHWFYGLILRADDHADINVHEKGGLKRSLEWRMEGKPLKTIDIDPEALRRIKELDQQRARDVRAVIAEMEAMADEADMMAEYEEWKTANPEEAEALHRRMVDLVHGVLDRVRQQDA